MDKQGAAAQQAQVTEIPSTLFGDRYHAKARGINPCSMCGKPTGGQKRTQNVHYTTNGTLTSLTEHADSQGFFPIGSECAKTLPKAFVFAGWDR